MIAEEMTADFNTWIKDLRAGLEDRNKRAVLRAAYGVYLGGWYTLSSRRSVGKNIFSEDWDAVIILDACRADVMREVGPEYDFISEVSSVWSVGSSSPEWTVNTFDDRWIDRIRETGYVTANAYSKRILRDRHFPPDHNTVPFAAPKWSVIREEDLAFIDHCWEYGHDEDLGNVDPEAVTNSALYHYRERNPERMVVHYQQPHTPYMGRAKRENRALTETERSPLIELKQKGNHREIWELYKDNLRLALDEVEVLLNNTEFEKVIITADHGDAFGELGFFGHVGGFVHPGVRKVPWVETTSVSTLSEEEGYRDVEAPPTKSGEGSTQEQLRNLGYI